MNYLGDFPTGATVYVPFHTFNAAGASVTLTGLATTDIEIYKNGVATTRASESGYTLLATDGIDFDGKTGIHGFSIDLSDNTDAGFFAAGNEYMVVVASVTVDSQTVNFVAATFSIERAGGALALLKNATYGLSAIETLVDDLESRLTAARAGYLDNLSAGAAALETTAQSILTDTAVIGAAGAGLTAVPWNAAWDAEVESEATDALNAYDPPTNAELIARTLPSASYFDPAADVVAHVTLVDTVTTLTNMPAAAPTAADNADAVWDELLAGHAGAGSAGLALSTASSGGVDPSVLADAVWDEALSGHSTAGTTGKKLTDLVNADLSGVATQASVNDLPTVAEFEARTLLAADYTVVSDLPSVPSAADIKTALEVDGGKLDHLWEMTEDDGGVRRLTTNALEQAPTGAGTSDLDELLASHDTEDTLGNVLNDLVEEIGGLYRLTAGALEQAPTGSGTALTAQETADAVNNLAPAGASGAAGSIRAQLEDAAKTGADGDTLKTLSDQIDGVQAGSGLTAQETANAVHNLAPVGVAAVGSIGANLDSILNGLTGVGLIPFVYTVTEPGGVVPISGVTVELYTEEALLNCVRRGITNSYGVVTFWMSTAGTYWIKSAKDGYSFELDSEAVAV